ncbi:alpha/beta hydrolase [Actinopolymorpha alba]|uniref:alpha/beta hydrolase n=1 Tax=Actinopolymorpha alba TaxID=533267 RepID=UPI00035CC5C3|nr:alpha/beta hydrolase [Actinopolymorpha alba]
MPRRSLLLITALVSSMGGAAVYLAPLPALWRTSWSYGLLFAGLGAAQLVVGGCVLARPTRRRVLLAAGSALAVVTLWVLTGLTGILPGPDPWTSVNTAVGFIDVICVALQIVAVAGLTLASAFGHRTSRSRLSRVLATAAVIPLTLIVLGGALLGVTASSDGFSGAGFPGGTAQPRNLPAGQRSTVEYCRPDGVPLAMDIYTPTSSARKGDLAPAVVYVHGGGPGVLGSRKLTGFSATLVNPRDALFVPLLRQLNARGFVVASIDFRLTPGTPWPAPVQDAKCAVRFLRAHAADLGIDAGRIGAWGSSGGGHLSAMLGLAGPEAGFDQGQYLEQSSAVQAVVDMFGPYNLADFDDTSPFGHFIVQVGLGSSPAIRRAASTSSYVKATSTSFLILHGAEDTDVTPRNSIQFAEKLRSAGVATTFIEVQGTGHTMATPGQHPSAEQLTDLVADFFARTLS